MSCCSLLRHLPPALERLRINASEQGNRDSGTRTHYLPYRIFLYLTYLLQLHISKTTDNGTRGFLSFHVGRLYLPDHSRVACSRLRRGPIHKILAPYVE